MPCMPMLPTFSETHNMNESHKRMYTDTNVASNRKQQAYRMPCTTTHSKKHSQKMLMGHGCQGRKMHDRYRLIMTRPEANVAASS